MKTPTIYYIFTYGKALKSYRNRHLNGAKSESAHINKKSHTYTLVLEKQRHRQWLNVIASSSWILGSPWIENKKQQQKTTDAPRSNRAYTIVCAGVCRYICVIKTREKQATKITKWWNVFFYVFSFPWQWKKNQHWKSSKRCLDLPQIFYADFFLHKSHFGYELVLGNSRYLTLSN